VNYATQSVENTRKWKKEPTAWQKDTKKHGDGYCGELGVIKRTPTSWMQKPHVNCDLRPQFPHTHNMSHKAHVLCVEIVDLALPCSAVENAKKRVSMHVRRVRAKTECKMETPLARLTSALTNTSRIDHVGKEARSLRGPEKWPHESSTHEVKNLPLSITIFFPSRSRKVAS